MTAIGGSAAAGIGSGESGFCGNIIIENGTITAAGGYDSAGIGSGLHGECGNITITGGNVTAYGKYASAGIGSSYQGFCSLITISGGTVMATGSDLGAGIGSGREGLCSEIIIGEGITRVTALGYTEAIGKGQNGDCYRITIPSSLNEMTMGRARTIFPGAPLPPFESLNEKLYTLTNKNGEMVMNAEGTGLISGKYRTDAQDKDKRFAILNIDGEQYLYSPSAKKYLRYDGSFVSELGSPITTDANFPDGEYKYMILTKNDDGETLVLNNYGYGINTNSNLTPIDGNRWSIEPVADFVIGLTLDDDGSNTDIISDYDGYVTSVTLSGRTLYTNGNWNTLCLPFDVDDFSGTPLEGAIAMELDTSIGKYSHDTGFDSDKKTLYLNFKEAFAIEAGHPYIVRYVIGEDLYSFTDPVFDGVTISNTAPQEVVTADGMATFKGTYDPVDLAKDDKTVLFMGAKNTLFYPNDDMTIGSFRAYFQLNNGLMCGEPGQGVNAMVLNFGEDTTGIRSTQESGNANPGRQTWFTIDGRRLNGKPVTKGVYIVNGHKVVK